MDTITKLSSDGTPLSPSSGFTGGGLNFPTAIAVDGSGSVWIANLASSISRNFPTVATDRQPLHRADITSGLTKPTSIAVDGSGNVWATSYSPVGPAILTEFIGAATPVVTPLAAAVKNNTIATRP